MPAPRTIERRFVPLYNVVVPVSLRDASGAPVGQGTAPSISLRADGDTGLPQIVGYSAVFNVETVIDTWFGPYREKIKKGAFRRAIREAQDVRALRNHDPDNLLGRTVSRTLKIHEDDTGLYIEVNTPDTAVGRDTIEMIRRGDLSGMSFAFIVKQEKWIMGDTEADDLRVIEDVDLYDVGPVTYPAYPQTSADIRSCSIVYQRGLAELGKEVPPLPDEDEPVSRPERAPDGDPAAVEPEAEPAADEHTPVRVLNGSPDDETEDEPTRTAPVTSVAHYRRQLAQCQSASLRNSLLTKLLTK